MYLFVIICLSICQIRFLDLEWFPLPITPVIFLSGVDVNRGRSTSVILVQVIQRYQFKLFCGIGYKFLFGNKFYQSSYSFIYRLVKFRLLTDFRYLSFQSFVSPAEEQPFGVEKYSEVNARFCDIRFNPLGLKLASLPQSWLIIFVQQTAVSPRRGEERICGTSLKCG